MKNITKYILLTLTMLTLFSIGTGALAQKRQGGVIRLETTTIEGRVQKPNAFFINTRRSMVYESLEVKESFIAKVSEIVDAGDF